MTTTDRVDVHQHLWVPELVEASKRTRMFGIFYTGTIGSGAVAPALYGLVGDTVGVPAALMVVAGTCLLTLPLTLVLRPMSGCRPPIATAPTASSP